MKENWTEAESSLEVRDNTTFYFKLCDLTIISIGTFIVCDGSMLGAMFNLETDFEN